jgi:hypothetical protein
MLPACSKLSSFPCPPVQFLSRAEEKTLISRRQTAFWRNPVGAVATYFCSLSVHCRANSLKWKTAQKQKRAREGVSGAFLMLVEIRLGVYALACSSQREVVG